MDNIKKLNIDCLEATKNDCDLYKLLSEGVDHTREAQTVIREEESVELPKATVSHQPKVTVSDKDCATAATAYPGKKTMIVNLGSETVQGGGAAQGESDAESELCRVSTLYRCLAWKTLWNDYYLLNSIKKPLLADMIYSPDIIVFKSARNPGELLEDDRWFKVDVLTAPLPKMTEIAVKLRNVTLPKLEDGEGEEKLYERFADICSDAKKKGIRLLVSPKPSKKYPLDEKVILDAFKKTIDKFGDYFFVIGNESDAFPPVPQNKLQELIYEQFADSCQKAFSENSRVVTLMEAPKNSGIEEGTMSEAFHKAIAEYNDYFKELTPEKQEELLTKRFERILGIACNNGARVLILPAPHKDCRIDATILVKALKNAIAKCGNGFETIEFALSPEYTDKITIASFCNAFFEPDVK